MYVPAILVPPVLSFLILVVFSRLLSTEEYGRYMLTVATVELLRGGTTGWLTVSYFRFYAGAEQDGTLPMLRSTVTMLFLGLTAVVAVGYALIVHSLPLEPTLRDMLLLGLVLLLSQSAALLVLSDRRAAGSDLQYSVLTAICAGSGFVAAIAIFMLLLPTEAALILGAAAGYALGLTSLTLSLRKIDLLGIDWGLARQLAGYGVPVAAALLLGFVVDWSDRYIIALLLGNGPAGEYAVGYALAARLITPLFVLVSMAGLSTAIKSLEQGGSAAAEPALKEGYELVLAVALPATLGLMLLAEPIVELVVGPAFRQTAIMIVPWIAVVGFLRGFKLFYLDHAFHLSKRTTLALYTVLPAGLLNVLLNLLLVPYFGLMGAVYATLATFVVAAAASWHLGRRVYPLPLPVGSLLRVLLACLPLVLVVVILDPASRPLPLCGTILAGAASYALAAFVLDIAGVRRVLTRRTGWRGMLH